MKDDAIKVLHSICQQTCKPQQWLQDRKRSVFVSIQKKGNGKECSNYCALALISHASKIMLKILQVRLQQYVNRELSDVLNWVWKRQRNQRSNCQHLLDHEKGREFQKIYTSASLTTLRPVWITTSCGIFSISCEYQTILPAS